MLINLLSFLRIDANIFNPQEITALAVEHKYLREMLLVEHYKEQHLYTVLERFPRAEPLTCSVLVLLGEQQGFLFSFPHSHTVVWTRNNNMVVTLSCRGQH